MPHAIVRSLATLVACVLVPLAFPACDVEEPDDELARELDEADEEDEDAPAGPHPTATDELASVPDPAAASNYFVPTGTHDVANCNVLEGWAKDGDTTSPTWVTIYRGAPSGSGGIYVATAYANLYRGDLPFSDKNHGFSIATPAALKTGMTEYVYIHAINVDTDGNWGAPGVTNPLLNATGKAICCGQGCGGGGGPTTGYDPNP